MWFIPLRQRGAMTCFPSSHQLSFGSGRHYVRIRHIYTHTYHLMTRSSRKKIRLLLLYNVYTEVRTIYILIFTIYFRGRKFPLLEPQRIQQYGPELWLSFATRFNENLSVDSRDIGGQRHSGHRKNKVYGCISPLKCRTQSKLVITNKPF